MALIHLIYVSTSTVELDVDELDRILVAAARSNEQQQVTGMLLYANGSFMQVLEGEEAAVDEIFERVRRDPRHIDVIVLEREPIAVREFDHWSMGFRRLSAADVSTHPGYAAFFSNGFNAQSIGVRPGLALDMLRDFGLTQRG